MEAVLGIPTPSQMFDALTVSLGHNSDFQAGRSVDHEVTFPATLKAFGISEERQAQYDEQGLLRPTRGSSYRPTLWRKYQLCFRYMREICIKGDNGRRVYQKESMKYMLTPYGVRRALQLAPFFDTNILEYFSPDEKEAKEGRGLDVMPIYDIKIVGFHDGKPLVEYSIIGWKRPEDETEKKINLTRVWFQQHWEHMWPKVQEFLARRLEKSHIQSLTDDHIHTFVERAIRCDSFHKHLKKNRKIYPSLLCQFVARSAFTELKTWGSDAACRATRGAYNERDREEIKKFHKDNTDNTKYRVHCTEEDNAHNGNGKVQKETGSVIDCVGHDAEMEMETMIEWETHLTKMRRVVNKRLPEPETHLKCYIMKRFWEFTYKEIAEQLHIPVRAANSYYKRTKKAVERRR